MIALESPKRNANRLGEVVQFVQRGITDQMRPLLSTEPPQRLVDQHAHRTTLPRRRQVPAYGDDVSSPEEFVRIAWLELAGPGHEDTSAMLIARHSEPHRRYHNATHVMWVLRHIDEILLSEPRDVDAEAIRAGGLFHDVVYDPTSTMNESESAQLAVDALRGLGWATDRLELIHDMIIATVSHEATSPEAEVLLDADLAVLGADPDTYAEYVRCVRLEYGFVDEAGWSTGRATVLRSFLERDTVFTTAAMSAREQSARRNLTDELHSLSG